jgi:ATP-dependent helicase/nuclease subunit B
VQTVPSRWLQRLLALIKASGLEAKLEPEQPWVEWARERDRAASFSPARAPEPRPPLTARPRKLSVTRIERWIANPYEIYAKFILKLEKLKALGTEPDAATRGQIVHRVLHEFFRAYPDALPDDIEAALVGIADQHFAKLDGSPFVRAFWQPHFRRFARWFAATEPGRRTRAVRVLTEVDGHLDLEVGAGFKLSARADRIDVLDDNAVVIYDYKTGTPPPAGQVDKLFAPQLPLEAAIAEAGGFPELGTRSVDGLVYVLASGRHEGDAVRDAGNDAPAALAAAARASLIALVARYDDPAMAYEVKRRRGGGFSYDYDEYEQLARIKEWLTLDAAEDQR